jgi:enolase-phosphatase E1
VIRGILLDIEGTTTPISFVYDVLFPYARAHIHDPHMLRLMDEDQKTTELKELQGRIWQDGYRRGELHGEVFDDVPIALERWRREGIDVRIYSSGSILAQKLLFGSTPAGDLTTLLNGYFDTTTGPKGDAESYVKIATAFGLSAQEILFVSDVVRELDAARSAGMQTALCVRPGNPAQPSSEHDVIRSFLEVRSVT